MNDWLYDKFYNSLSIEASYSRLSVSNDKAFSEALFKTILYNNALLHKGLKYVIPDDKKATKGILLIPEEEPSAADIVRMFDIGVKIERISRGAPRENRQISEEAKILHEGPVGFKITNDLDFSTLNDEELQSFELMLEKIYRPQIKE